MLERIDHVVAVVPDLATAAAAYERLGVVLTPETRHAETGAANRACFIGTDPENYSYIELLSVVDETRARASGRGHYADAAARGAGLVSIVFGVSDIAAASAVLHERGLAAPVETIHREDGSKVCDVAQVATPPDVPFRVALIQYPETWQARYTRSVDAGRFAHSLPLKRLDHLAAIAPDLDAATAFWSGIMGVPVVGELRTPAMTIRQLKIGDAMFELLGPSGPESPFAGRPASLASMAAWEVSGPLDDTVAAVAELGFTCPPAEAGVIPGTRRSSIPAGELAGVGMQLLEYV